MYRLVLACCLLLAACSKSGKDGPGDPQQPQGPPLSTQRGTPVGPLVTATIGTQGGQLATADGRIKITVPAGAVSTNQTFSIQPVTNTLRPGKSATRSYRLLPENTNFSKPVTVVMEYDPMDISTGLDEVMRLAYQTTEGRWKSVPAVLNQSNHTLTAQVNHFCDFAFYEQFELFADNTIAFPNEKVNFKVGVIKTADDNDDFLAPLLHLIPAAFDYNADNNYEQLNNAFVTRVRGWKVVSGGGTIAPKNNGYKILADAEYTAPAQVAESKEVIVEVSLEGLKPIPDPSAPGGKRPLGQLIMRKTIRLVPDAWAIATWNGQDYSLDAGQTAVAVGGITSVAAFNNTQGMGFSLSVGGMAQGVFPCGLPQANSGKASVSFNFKLANGTAVVASTSYCESVNNQTVSKFSSGNVKITRFADSGDFIEGEWAGSVYQELPNTHGCQFEAKTLALRFRVRRQ